jgi:hypothetical protein
MVATEELWLYCHWVAVVEFGACGVFDCDRERVVGTAALWCWELELCALEC